MRGPSPRARAVRATRTANPIHSRSGSLLTVPVADDAPDARALLHRLEGAIDLFERQGVADHLVHLDAPIHVPVDVLRQLRAAAGTAERGAPPHTARHEEERP